MTHSLLTLLEQKSLTKEFYEASHKKCYNIIASERYNFKEPLTKLTAIAFINEIGSEFNSITENMDSEDLVDDDVFGFAAQQYLVDLSEDADNNQDKMFVVKKFLTYHTIYAEAMKDSPYDKVLKQLAGEDPSNYTVSATTISSEPVKTIFDDIDPKYIDCKFTFKTSKTYQKPKLYSGCKFIKVGDDLKNHYIVNSFDDIVITDDQGIFHQIKDSYPIFITEKASIGDIVLLQSKYVIVADKKTLDIINSFYGSKVFFTTKFNNRKVETIKVKRFSCGTLDKDLSTVPYHINIVYEDINVNHELDAISKHYNINHDKLIAKEVDIIKQIEVALDHPLNVKRKEWVMLTGESGSGKTSIAIDYASNKGAQYVIQQGHAQLTVDDLLGYKSITDGTYFPSLMRDAVENGKVFIIDEIDACNPNTLLALNSLKNGKFQFADGLVEIHENFRLIGTANTLEYSDVYNGRSKLDKATLARFKHIDYNLEKHHLAIRYGLEHVKSIQNIDRLEPREVERLVTEAIIAKELNQQDDN